MGTPTGSSATVNSAGGQALHISEEDQVVEGLVQSLEAEARPPVTASSASTCRTAGLMAGRIRNRSANRHHRSAPRGSSSSGPGTSGIGWWSMARPGRSMPSATIAMMASLPPCTKRGGGAHPATGALEGDDDLARADLAGRMVVQRDRAGAAAGSSTSASTACSRMAAR